MHFIKAILTLLASQVNAEAATSSVPNIPRSLHRGRPLVVSSTPKQQTNKASMEDQDRELGVPSSLHQGSPFEDRKLATTIDIGAYYNTTGLQGYCYDGTPSANDYDRISKLNPTDLDFCANFCNNLGDLSHQVGFHFKPAELTFEYVGNGKCQDSSGNQFDNIEKVGAGVSRLEPCKTWCLQYSTEYLVGIFFDTRYAKCGCHYENGHIPSEYEGYKQNTHIGTGEVTQSSDPASSMQCHKVNPNLGICECNYDEGKLPNVAPPDLRVEGTGGVGIPVGSGDLDVKCYPHLGYVGQPVAAGDENAWAVGFVSATADFSTDSVNELELEYTVGKGRVVDTELLDYATCATEITIGYDQVVDISDLTISTIDGDSERNKLVFGYSIDKSKISGSGIWNDAESKIQLCLRVKLLSDAYTITEDTRKIDINFELTRGYSVGPVGVSEAAAETAPETDAGIDDYVEACKCSSVGVCEEPALPLAENTELYVCIKSKEVSVEIEEIKGLDISQDGADDFPVIDDAGSVVNPALSSFRFDEEYNGVIVATRVPSNSILFSADETISIAGSVLLKFKTGRKLEVNLNTNVIGDGDDRNLQGEVGTAEETEASFKLDIAVEPQESSDDLVNSAKIAGASNAFAIIGFVAASAYVMLW